MNICIPIVEDRGFLSPISPHFARAPMFLLVEPSSLAHRCVPNPDPEPGRCDLHDALDHEPIGSFIVGGIGANALGQLARRNVPVYGTRCGNVADALTALIAGRLTPLEPT
ncbi:NifB/NifX family molybdenum-iron cluster-binding protein [Anaeromyxobacter sp. PSR-1]|uniref:NifB/NifX family molybdenum-iron cluster-binding protein n=1 Tax=Anaeromyxobacter sp. PSR-1 TaxID=1300915 RepID=UPI0005E0C135|nr:NifB/NifX family molybdenum-iron cluster-binding protein [Anaeromyxobacter sp. PSR-1]GAO01509.1 dinitrogenase iron-molybdenum cofactor [Anaeromyxobacter sp. PSR-1]